jgi:hypothetical protein
MRLSVGAIGPRGELNAISLCPLCPSFPDSKLALRHRPRLVAAHGCWQSYRVAVSSDELLIRQMSCDSAFHGIPHQIAAAHRMKTECLGSVPDQVKHNLIRVRNSLFLVQRHDI